MNRRSKPLRKILQLLLLFCFGITFNSYAQDIGWLPYSSGVSGENFKNRVKQEHYSPNSLSILKKVDVDVIVYPGGINKIVAKNMPDFENILTQRLLNNGVTLKSLSPTSVILDIKTFKSDEIISFNMRLLVKSNSFFQTNNAFLKSDWEEKELSNTIFWECIQFGFVKTSETEKLKEYTMECIK